MTRNKTGDEIALYQPCSRIWPPVAKIHSKLFSTPRKTARASKLRPSPEPRDSLIIIARQRETSAKGGVLHSAPRDAREASLHRMLTPTRLEGHTIKLS